MATAPSASEKDALRWLIANRQLVIHDRSLEGYYRERKTPPSSCYSASARMVQQLTYRGFVRGMLMTRDGVEAAR